MLREDKKAAKSNDVLAVDLVAVETAQLALHYDERTKADKEKSRRFDHVTIDPDGTISGKSLRFNDHLPLNAKSGTPVRYSAPSGRPREEAFQHEGKHLIRLEQYVLEHEFEGPISGQVEQMKKASPTAPELKACFFVRNCTHPSSPQRLERFPP